MDVLFTSRIGLTSFAGPLAILVALSCFACNGDREPPTTSPFDGSMAEPDAQTGRDAQTVRDSGASDGGRTGFDDSGLEQPDAGAARDAGMNEPDTGPPRFLGVVGDPCTVISDCSGVLSCFVEGGGPTDTVNFPGGYCSTSCEDAVDCADSICVAAPDGTRFCAAACGAGDSCMRTGYSCQSLGAQSACLGD